MSATSKNLSQHVRHTTGVLEVLYKEGRPCNSLGKQSIKPKTESLSQRDRSRRPPQKPLRKKLLHRRGPRHALPPLVLATHSHDDAMMMTTWTSRRRRQRRRRRSTIQSFFGTAVKKECVYFGLSILNISKRNFCTRPMGKSAPNTRCSYLYTNQ